MLVCKKGYTGLIGNRKDACVHQKLKEVQKTGIIQKKVKCKCKEKQVKCYSRYCLKRQVFSLLGKERSHGLDLRVKFLPPRHLSRGISPYKHAQISEKDMPEVKDLSWGAGVQS